MAAELEKAQDNAARIARGALAKIVQRLNSMTLEEIPAAILHKWIKTLTDVELKALGHEERSSVSVSNANGEPLPLRVIWHESGPKVGGDAD